MKRVLFSLLALFIANNLFSQNTYFWVGGTTGTWSSSASWNTALDGSGTSRSTPNDADVLTIDGTNIGGSAPATGAITPIITGSFNVGQLKLINGTSVTMIRTGTSGTSSIVVLGDGTTGTDDLFIDGTSTLKLNATASGFGVAVSLGIATTNLATGTIVGTIYIQDGGLATTRLTVANANSLVFGNGSICYANTSVSSAYPFGNSSQGSVGGVLFNIGSKFIYQGGNNPMANSTHNPFIMQKGSTLVLEASNPAGLFTNRVFGNVLVRNNTTVTLVENFYGIDTLTIETGSAFYHRASGTAPFSGNIINNGIFGAASGYTSAHLIMIGTVPQTISGSGSFSGTAAFSIATDADVTINTNIKIGSASGPPTSTITGKLNVQNFNINSIGSTVAGNFQLRPAATATTPGTLTQGSYTVTLNATYYSSTANTANVSIGGLVTGTGILPNTYVIATSSSASTFTISKPATIGTAADGASITITNNPATLSTTNANGVDGSITTTATRTFGSGSNYIFNSATTTPFSTVSTTNAGNVTFNAAATTNRNIGITGTLTINNGKLTIRPLDTLSITSGNAIAGLPFSSSKYIVTDKNIGGDLGVLQISNFATPTLFPIGSSNYYLPATLTPSIADSFAISVFDGATIDGKTTSTAMTSTQKTKIVDAIWNIKRISSSTTNCMVELAWPTVLEGSSFTSYTNSQIGVSRFNGTTWDYAIGSGNNTNNTASSSFSSFSPFGVGEVGSPLPIKFKNINASQKNTKLKISWELQDNSNAVNYTLEKSNDGIYFANVVTIKNENATYYEYYDNNTNSVSYYRVKALSKDGNFIFSKTIKTNFTKEVYGMSIYPNPAKKQSTLSVTINNDKEDILTLNLYNAVGMLVVSQNIKTNGGVLTQSISLPNNLSNGLYFASLTSNNIVVAKTKFLIQ